MHSKANRNYEWIILNHHFIPKSSNCHSLTALSHNHKLINESKKHSLKVSLKILLLHSIIISFVFLIFLGHRQKANSNKCTKHINVKSLRNAIPCIYRIQYQVEYTLDAGLLARSQYSEGPATGQLDTGFSWFPCVYKQMLRWFPTFQVATICFSCSPPDLNLVITNFTFCLHVK